MHQVHAVVDDGDDRHAEHGAADGAAAARQGRAAQDRRGDGVHLVAVQGRGLAAVQLGGVQHARQGRHDRADHMAQEYHVLGVDAGQVGDLLVGAGGVHVAAEDGLRQQDVHDGHHDDDEYRDIGDPAVGVALGGQPAARADEAVGLRDAGNGGAAREDEAQAAADGLHGQGRDHGHHVHPADHKSVKATAYQAHHDGGDDQDRDGAQPGQAGDPRGDQRGDDAGQRAYRADGDIDAAQYDDVGQARGQHGVDGHLGGQVHQVVGGEELAAGTQAKAKDQGDQDHDHHVFHQEFLGIEALLHALFCHLITPL